MKPRVLWIEDSAQFELSSLVGPIYYDGNYDLDIAEDVTKAIRLMSAIHYDVLIVDVRLPPGIDHHWRKLYEKAGADKVRAHLGLRLLGWLLKKENNVFHEAPPPWVHPTRIAVFTVESKKEILACLDDYGISLYQQKSAGHEDTILLEMIRILLARELAGNGTH